MNKTWLTRLALVLLGFVLCGIGANRPAHKPTRVVRPQVSRLQQVVDGAKEYDGLFKLHQKDDHLYAEIKPHQFDQPFLCPIAIARGGWAWAATRSTSTSSGCWSSSASATRSTSIRRNVRFKAKAGSPSRRRSRRPTPTRSCWPCRSVASTRCGRASLIDLNDIFMTDFAQLGLGCFDASRSTWHKIKAFPK